MKARNNISRTAIYVLSIGAAAASSCKKSPASTVVISQAAPLAAEHDALPAAAAAQGKIISAADEIARIRSAPGLTQAAKALLIAQVPREVSESTQAIKDRQELVLPPPPGWKPENVRRKLKLTLIPEKTMIRVNTFFRYRLEIQNEGREPVLLSEDSPGFIKDGRVGTHWFEFYVTPPGGEETMVANSFGAMFDNKPVVFREYQFPDSMTTAEKDAAFEKIKANHKAENNAREGLSLFLQPGETLLTRPNPPPPNSFRNLDIDLGFNKPGTYRIKAAYDDRPIGPATDEHAQSMARRMLSNSKDLPNRRLSSAEKKLLQSIAGSQGLRKEQKEDIKWRDEGAPDSLGFIESNTVLLEVVR